MTTFTRILIATLATTGVALAQPRVDPKAPTASVDPKAKVEPKADVKTEAKMEMPKPPAELADYAKATAGNWRCTGTETQMDGNTSKITGTVKTRLDPDKWWVVDTIEARGTQGTFKMTAYTTYDAAAKKWRRVAVNNHGGQMIGSSEGIEDNKADWNMDVTSAMGAGQFRDHVDMTDPKAGVKMWGEMSMDKGKTWQRAYEWTCKKG
jgi:hypothetical protein